MYTATSTKSRASTKPASLSADGDGIRVMFESSEAKEEGDVSQGQDDEPTTLFQPAANRQVPGQRPRPHRITPQLAPPAEQSSQSVPDVTGPLSASV